jgi:hypothetical protein
MVMHRATPAMKYSNAVCKPPKINQRILPISFIIHHDFNDKTTATVFSDRCRFYIFLLYYNQLKVKLTAPNLVTNLHITKYLSK